MVSIGQAAVALERPRYVENALEAVVSRRVVVVIGQGVVRGHVEGAVGLELVVPRPLPVRGLRGLEPGGGAAGGVQITILAGVQIEVQRGIDGAPGLPGRDRRRLELAAPHRLHGTVVLLRPAGLRLGHLGRQQELARAVRGRQIFLAAVQPMREEEHPDEVADQVVVGAVEQWILDLDRGTRPGLGVASSCRRPRKEGGARRSKRTGQAPLGTPRAKEPGASPLRASVVVFKRAIKARPLNRLAARRLR